MTIENHKQAYKYEEVKQYFLDYLEDNKEYMQGYLASAFYTPEDLHHRAFNEDYYIIGTYKAKQWLADQAFDIIGIIREWEEFNIGSHQTDISDPEKVVNMYVYILGEYIVEDYLSELEKNREEEK